MLLSARRAYIDLTREEAERLSPLRHAAAVRCPVIVITGEHESPEFIRQGMAFAGALQQAGRDAELIQVPGYNHFEMNEALGRAGTVPHAAAVRLAQRIAARQRAGAS